jgi:3-methyladenine DNA glycosylase AlkC
MKCSEIATHRLEELNWGKSETTNLTEWLAVDQSTLLRAISAEFDDKFFTSVSKAVPKLTVPKQIAWIGAQLAAYPDISQLMRHRSDVVRCWSAYALTATRPKLNEALEIVRPFAADSHFGVREIAWMAVREQICADPLKAIDLLLAWTSEKDANLRRFSTEATRPRGVWAKHITMFKNDPSPAEKILNALNKDPARYVQDSVGNWLNDAAKDNPNWVKKLTQSWKDGSLTIETNYIIKRALRSLN